MAARLTPPEGLPTWPAADPTLPSGPEIPGGLDVELVEELDSGWARVRCSNGWEAWVDGRRLLTTPSTAAGGSAPSRRNLVIVGGLAALAVVAFLATRGGDDDKRTLSATSSGAAGVTVGSPDAADVDLMAIDEAAVTKAVADAKAAPASQRPFTSTDEGAAQRISDAMKAAGFDLGPDVMVMPLGPDANLLLLELNDASPLTKLEGDAGDKFLKTFVTLPALSKAKVTRLAIDFVSKDDKGPFTLSLTARVDDLRRSVENGEDISDKAAIQVVRG